MDAPLVASNGRGAVGEVQIAKVRQSGTASEFQTLQHHITFGSLYASSLYISKSIGSQRLDLCPHQHAEGYLPWGWRSWPPLHLTRALELDHRTVVAATSR